MTLLCAPFLATFSLNSVEFLTSGRSGFQARMLMPVLWATMDPVGDHVTLLMFGTRVEALNVSENRMGLPLNALAVVSLRRIRGRGGGAMAGESGSAQRQLSVGIAWDAQR